MSDYKREATGLQKYLAVFRYTGAAATLVWETSRRLTVVLAILTVVGGLIPAGIAIVGKQIVDGVLLAAETGTEADQWAALTWVGVEGGLVMTLAGCRRALEVCNQLLRAQLGNRVNVLILRKALTLDLVHFEDAELYDKMTRARREASSRPLALVKKSFGLVQNTISLVTYGVLLLQFSGWAVLVLALAAIPAFVAETRFAGEAFQLFRWRSPEKRKQAYLEVVVAREDYAKEVQLLDLGPTLVDRYQAIFDQLYGEDRNLTLRRGGWGYVLSLLSTGALYGAYAWIAAAAVAARITLGQMTMYLLVFKQGQGAFAAILRAVGGMYEDNLYLSNLYEFLDVPVSRHQGEASEGPDRSQGIEFRNVSFTYPGASAPALKGISFQMRPGTKLALVGRNGSGKTTLIKLLTRLYQPSEGQVLLDGLDLQKWDTDALRVRVGVIFQDFVKYQLTVGENIGVGDIRKLEDTAAQTVAAEKGMALPFIEDFEDGLQTQLGRWFFKGRELSIGQWQKVALSRALIREDADILVLDEPTSAMDAEAEAEIFNRLRDMAADQMALLISHRFSTVRMADRIVVLDDGQVVQDGTHETLMAEDGRYAALFTLQAAGYR